MQLFFNGITAGDLDLITAVLDIHMSLLEAINPSTERSPLETAALYGRIEIMSYLIKIGASPNIPNPLNGNTAMHYAAFSGQIRAMIFLNKSNEIPTGKWLPFNVINPKTGLRPIHSAIFGNQKGIILFLSQHKEVPLLERTPLTVLDRNNYTLLNYAAALEEKDEFKGKYKELIEFLSSATPTEHVATLGENQVTVLPTNQIKQETFTSMLAQLLSGPATPAVPPPPPPRLPATPQQNTVTPQQPSPATNHPQQLPYENQTNLPRQTPHTSTFYNFVKPTPRKRKAADFLQNQSNGTTQASDQVASTKQMAVPSQQATIIDLDPTPPIGPSLTK
jgi:hypothetical protein